MRMFEFWESGIWVLPMIVCMCFMVIMMFFCMRFFSGPRRCFPYDRDYDRHMNDAGSKESALEILNRRYAQGEIQKEEYERIKKDILN